MIEEFGSEDEFIDTKVFYNTLHFENAHYNKAVVEQQDQGLLIWLENHIIILQADGTWKVKLK